MTRKMRKLMTLVLIMLLTVAAVKPMEVKAMPRACGRYAWTLTDMCLRSYPGLGGNIVTVVPAGAEVVVVSTDDNPVDGFHWAYVRYPDVEGYMAYANQAQTLTFLEFQRWNDVEGSSGTARILREVTLYSGPNPELSGELAQLDQGEKIDILTEMAPVKYGSHVAKVSVYGMEGYIPANNDVADFYEYLGNPDSSESASIAPTTTDAEIDKLGIVNRPMCLRTRPTTTNSEIIRVLDTFEEVWVEAVEAENWYRVINGTDQGYIATFGVNVGRTLDRDAETTTDLNLRSGPSTDAQRWVTLPEGLPVWAMSEFDGVGASENSRWVRVAVEFKGRKYYGFVIKQGLSIL